MYHNNNCIEVTGTVIEGPEFAFESGLDGARYKMYQATVASERLSGYEDELHVIVPKVLSKKLEVGKKVTVVGSVRTYNKYNKELGKNETKIFIFAKNVYDAADKEDSNRVNIVGTICKKPVLRQTPYEKTICDLIVAVNTTVHHSDYIPTICWGRNAVVASNFEVGDKVKIEGRLQSRAYNKVIDGVTYERVAYELSSNSIIDYEEDEEGFESDDFESEDDTEDIND